MICVSITKPEHLSLISSFEMIELRADLLNVPFNTLLPVFYNHQNVIYTCRPGIYDDSIRLEMYLRAMKSGVKYIDLEENAHESFRKIIREAAEKWGTIVILSYHNFQRVPENETLCKLIESMSAKNADVIKIVGHAESAEEAERLLALYDVNYNLLLIAFAMGDTGRYTRWKCLDYGAPFTYAAVSHDTQAASGQITYIEMTEIVKSKLFAVCGNPIRHSLSPDIYNYLFKKHRVNCQYFRILAETASEALLIYKTLNLTAMNITAPFKEQIKLIVDSLTDDAREIGSVNTMITKNHITGYNTDVYGIIRSLKRTGEAENKKALVIGAGGAARAAIYALKNLKCNITIINRTFSKAESLSKEFFLCADCWENIEENILKNDLIISTLPVNLSSINEMIPSGKIFLTANYQDEKSIAELKNRGIAVAEGLDWLIFQAIEAFRLYTGLSADYQEIRYHLNSRKSIKKSQNLTFIGFMGAGKTTVGAILAQRTSRRFIDIDQEIETITGMSVNEIFQLKGEHFFRKLESETLAAYLKEDNLIISCGGGIVVNRRNREMIKEKSVCIWIFADINESVQGIWQNRPLLQVSDPLNRAWQLFEERKKYYAETCNFLIFNKDRTPAACAQLIYCELFSEETAS